MSVISNYDKTKVGKGKILDCMSKVICFRFSFA